MPPRPRKKPPPRVNTAEQSLLIFIQALEGRKLMVELRNDTLIRGKLETVDDYMNLTMSTVNCQTLTGSKSDYEFLYVKGRNIRFIHLPKTIEPAQAIEDQRQAKVTAQLAGLKERFRSENQGAKGPKGVEDPGVLAAQRAADAVAGGAGAARQSGGRPGVLLGRGQHGGVGTYGASSSDEDG